MEFRVLGPLEVVASGQPLALGGFQQRAVLALLLVSAPEPVSHDRLIDELWGERPPATAIHAVQVYVSGIRKILRAAGDDAVVRSSPAGYFLDLKPEQVDSARFERLVAEAQRRSSADPARARDVFSEALDLWRGRPLPEFAEFDFARLEADRLEEVHARAVEGLVEARLECGAHTDVIGQLTGLVTANPLREAPRRLLMLALYRSGRHPEALSAYRDAVRALDEIGLQPSPELRELEKAILQHDPVLSPSRSTTGGDDEMRRAVAPAFDGGRAAPLPLATRRKVITALFCDVTGSTALGEELDPEALHGVMNRYWHELRTVIERHGGTIEKFIGDAVVAVFGVPQVREDDALRAVRAAAEIRERLPSVAEEVGVALSFRTGVNTGRALVGEGENLAVGDAMNVAARLEQAAAPGEILLGEETVSLVRDAVRIEPLEPLALKGKSAPVPAFRLLSVEPLAPGISRHLDAPMVGRERELGTLRAAWERAVSEPGCHLFTVLGPAGVGKSRLVAELLASVGDAAFVLTGRCLHYGEGITFWPLIEALTLAGEPAEAVLERLRAGGAIPEELFFEVRRELEALALERPVILHVDDLQWGEPMLLELLDHVADLSRGAPILLLCVGRPELLENRPGWGGGKLNSSSVLLGPLQADDCELLLDHLGVGLPPDDRATVIAASEGNPLFLEEMAALAGERGTVTVPPTIQALLTARLELLSDQERQLLELGAIEGEVFHRRAVGALAGGPPSGESEARLMGLVRKELIRPHPPTFRDDEAFRFRHLLIRDAAYDSVPKARRADLHQAFAAWLECNAVELTELDEIAGWHLEQAVRYHHELRRETDPDLARSAAKHLRAAGRRASRRGDTNAALTLLERAHALAPDGETERIAIGVELAEELLEGGDLARVDALLSAAEENDHPAAGAELVRLRWLFLVGDRRDSETKLGRLIRELAQTGDDHMLARAHFAAAQVTTFVGKFTTSKEHARLAAEHARRAGDHGLRARAAGWVVADLIVGPDHATTMARELEDLEAAELGPYVDAWIVGARGELARLGGDLSRARRLMHQAIARCEDFGAHFIAAGHYHQLANLEIQAGHPSAAVARLVESDAILAELGERGFRSSTQALIARAQLLLGDHAAARRALALCDELSEADDMVNQAITGSVRAHLALAAGDATEAERWARGAVDSAAQAGPPFLHGHSRLGLAALLYKLGRAGEATEQVEAALALFEAKGDQASIKDARALLAEHAPAA